MYYARRMIPNMVLNKIYDQNIVYVTQQYAEKEMVKHVGEHEVKELIKKELYAQDSQRRHS